MVSKLHPQLLQQPIAAALKGWRQCAPQSQLFKGVALVQPCSLLILLRGPPCSVQECQSAACQSAACSPADELPPHLVELQAFQCVPEEAVAATVHTLHCMLQHTPPQLLQRLREFDADVGIIGRHQVPEMN